MAPGYGFDTVKVTTMPQETTTLQKRIESGKPIIIAEIAPPRALDAAPIRALAKKIAGKVHALGVSDNRDSIRMSAMAAASIIFAEKVEPILHMVTRDRNRIALLSDCIGAQDSGHPQHSLHQRHAPVAPAGRGCEKRL